jgi:hypothetical protein
MTQLALDFIAATAIAVATPAPVEPAAPVAVVAGPPDGPTTKIIGSFTHCTPDCEELGHDWTDHTVCDRCGAHVHKRVFEVERIRSDGTVEHMRVGAECFKDVMGYSWKKAHDKALAVHSHIMNVIAGWNDKRSFVRLADMVKVIEEARIDLGRHPELHVPRTMNASGTTWGSTSIKTQFGFSKTVARAGEDLGLWTQYGDGGRYKVNFC